MDIFFNLLILIILEKLIRIIFINFKIYVNLPIIVLYYTENIVPLSS